MKNISLALTISFIILSYSIFFCSVKTLDYFWDESENQNAWIKKHADIKSLPGAKELAKLKAKLGYNIKKVIPPYMVMILFGLSIFTHVLVIVFRPKND